ncbi:MAG: hypothetical protein KDE27_24625 [Planctomycetes bacterium]|nr:hypothetical protein [Planctomycetota bacterium]
MRAPSLVGILAALAACGGGPTGSPGLPGSVRPDIPVFQPSQLERDAALEVVDLGEGDDEVPPPRRQGHSWDLSTPRPVAEVRAFYRPLTAPAAAAAPPTDEVGDELEDEDIGPGVAGWDDEEEDDQATFDDQTTFDDEDTATPAPTPVDPAATLRDTPSDTFRLTLEDGETEIEVTVYRRSVQRRTWFTLRELRR